MNYTAKLRKADGSDWADIAVPMGRTILETALAEGLDFPHGCRSGNCGGCKSHLIDGEVEMSPYSEFALSEEEKAQGIILCCRRSRRSRGSSLGSCSCYLFLKCGTLFRLFCEPVTEFANLLLERVGVIRGTATTRADGLHSDALVL